MPITRAKPADQLYRDCRDHDLVLVKDPSLADALTNRVEAPRFGPFATTPRRLAAGRERAEDRTAFLQVIQETDLSWKEAAYTVGNVLHCWEHRGDPRALLEYDGFATAAAEEVLDCILELDLTSKRLGGTPIDPELDVAVVGIEEYSPLERSILPESVDQVSPFTDESFELPPFREFDSPAAIVDAVLESVSAENADRVAIVLDQSSAYSPLVEAALEAADIPFYGGPGFTDHPDHRAFLQLLRVAHGGRDVRLADTRALLDRLGADVPIDHVEKRLHAVDLPGVSWLTEFCEEAAERSFEAALDAFESATGAATDVFRAELDRLGLLAERTTDAAVGQLEFYLRTYEVPVERENEGVLLADAKAAGTVDRPAVFYLGLDEGWTHSPPRRPWVDRDAEFTRHLQQFQRLLQNGTEQYYLVQATRGGRPVTPCLYFEELLDGFEGFDGPGVVRHERTFRPAGTGFDREPLGVEPDPVEGVSQSGLNRFVNCPRDYLFGRLVDGPDKDYFTVGNLFHDFAECYVNHPEQFDEEALDAVVELMLAETRPFDRPVDVATNRTRYRAGLETIVAYLDAHPPVGAPFLTADSGWGRNVVADHLGLPVDTPHTEWWFSDRELGLKGKVDLVHSPTHLLDYKSGRRYSASRVVKHASMDPPSDKPNFQALLYLTHHRTRVADESLQFTFFHFLETLDDVVAGDANLADCLTTITYHPVPFEVYMARPATFEALCEDAAGDCCKTFSQIEYDDYAAVVDGHAFPDTRDSGGLMASPLGEALYTRLQDRVGDYAYVENGCAQALRYLRDIRDRNFFEADLDAFEAFVDERLEELNRYRAGETRFPVEGLGGEPNWRRVDHRDLILEDDG